MVTLNTDNAKSQHSFITSWYSLLKPTIHHYKYWYIKGVEPKLFTFIGFLLHYVNLESSLVSIKGL